MLPEDELLLDALIQVDISRGAVVMGPVVKFLEPANVPGEMDERELLKLRDWVLAVTLADVMVEVVPVLQSVMDTQ